MFWISEFKIADADRMAAVLEASKKWQNEKKTLFYVLVSVYLLTTFTTAKSLTIIMVKS